MMKWLLIPVALFSGYAWGYWASTQVHGDWIISRTENMTLCSGTDIASGVDLGTWQPQVDKDGYARCHPRGALNKMWWKGFF